MQRRILDLALASHPLPLTFEALAAASPVDPADLAGAIVLASAVRDLALAGLLESDGLHVLPTRAALYQRRLDE